MFRDLGLRISALFSLPLCLTSLVLLAAVPDGHPAATEEEPIAPIAAAAQRDEAKVALGEKLFQDQRLSRNDTIACASCHRLESGGDDDRALSVAADGRPLDFNAPTIFNVGLNFRLNWRGNFRTLEEQNEAVLLSLMNIGWEDLLAKLGADADYRRRFVTAYGAAPDRESVLDALAAYQRSLTTPGARFDRYLRGDLGAITADEQRGYRQFEAFGCASCHQGVNVGGNLFQKFGVFSDPFAGPKTLTEADLGRFAVTGLEQDRHVFRVPSLRNVALTAPYFHDGRTASLAEAVRLMARYQLGREIAPSDVELIVKFLATLTGEHDRRPPVGERR